MAKPKFKSYNQGQVSLFPPSLDEKVPKNSPARIINQIVDNLDLSKVFDTYKGGGTTAYNPRMMLKVVLYGYLNNIYSRYAFGLPRILFQVFLDSSKKPFKNLENIRREFGVFRRFFVDGLKEAVQQDPLCNLHHNRGYDSAHIPSSHGSLHLQLCSIQVKSI